MFHTTNEELERFGKLWDSWQAEKKPARHWFSWWCVAHPDIADDQKIATFQKSLQVQ